MKFPFGFSPYKEKRHSLAFLNITQCLGVINDNLFKLVLVYLLIDIQGTDQASSILSFAGAVYVAPFLLFSSAAGVIADRFSKQRLLLYMKGAEVLILLLAIIAFAFKSGPAGYTLLFLLSTHSALFGPSKYGIIPELVSTDNISKANGLITSFTYLGIILGTFLASFLTEITGHRFPFVAAFALLLAIIGFATVFGIRRTAPQGSKKTIHPFFVREIFRTLLFCRTQRHLLPTICGAAYFLFIGAFTQLNIIPFALQSLGLHEVDGGYLFLSTALGIALGAYLCGKISKKKIELGISCLSLFCIAWLLLFIPLFSHHLIAEIILLILIGFFGGSFIVPFESFAQANSPPEKRGQVIAAANFLSFSGVLLACLALYFFSQVLKLSSASGFAFIGLITLVTALLFTARLSDIAFHYFSKKLLKPLLQLEVQGLDLLSTFPSAPLILTAPTPFKAALLLGIVPQLHLLIPQKSPFPWNLFYSLHCTPPTEERATAIATGKQWLKEDERLCLYGSRDGSAKPLSGLKALLSTPETEIAISIEQTGTRAWKVEFHESISP